MTSGMQFTDRASKALNDAQELAQQYSHSQLLPLHLAVALIEPATRPIQGPAKTELNRHHSSAKSSSAHMAIRKLLDRALKKGLTQKDSYVAVDHLIQSLAQDSTIQRCLAEANIPKPSLIDQAIQQIRGSKRVDSKTADAEEGERET
ncbi:putative heat shock protein hsp98 hsp104 protein [Botryosphaeria dothidea]|uniref:Heat shock protein hsp98 hsp104 protein n=1 Tax=Botryosphaeria dothidea TaxID=55169 RepID=A0A8H4MXM9_9PEZI|nr:putative heat shock protein hsp98 hsp104 protein [Botryosphaeria dothidea]